MADAPMPRAATVRAGLTPGAAVLLVASVVVAFVLADAFVLAHRTIGWVVACSVVALLIDPVVTFVSRLLPRWLSVLLVLIGVLAVIAALVAGLATDLLDSIEDLEASAPVAAESLQERYEFLDRMDLEQRVTDFVEELDARIRKDAVSEAIGTAPTYVVTGILMLFLLAYGRRYFGGFADQFGEERRERILQVGHDAAQRGRRYLLVVILQSILNGVAVGLACRWLDLDASFSLGFVAGALTVIPMIGVLVGGIPALLLAFGPAGVEHRAVVAVRARPAAGRRDRPGATVRGREDRPGGPDRADHRRPARPRALRHRGRGVRDRAVGDRAGRPRQRRPHPRRRARTGRYVTGSDQSSDCSSNVSLGLCSIDATAAWIRLTASTTLRGCWASPPTRMSR
jgi:predicted PurR-regulated permease PerM